MRRFLPELTQIITSTRVLGNSTSFMCSLIWSSMRLTWPSRKVMRWINFWMISNLLWWLYWLSNEEKLYAYMLLLGYRLRKWGKANALLWDWNTEFILSWVYSQQETVVWITLLISLGNKCCDYLSYILFFHNRSEQQCCTVL